jgi:hypothetical protein
LRKSCWCEEEVAPKGGWLSQFEKSSDPGICRTPGHQIFYGDHFWTITLHRLSRTTIGTTPCPVFLLFMMMQHLLVPFLVATTALGEVPNRGKPFTQPSLNAWPNPSTERDGVNGQGWVDPNGQGYMTCDDDLGWTYGTSEASAVDVESYLQSPQGKHCHCPRSGRWAGKLTNGTWYWDYTAEDWDVTPGVDGHPAVAAGRGTCDTCSTCSTCSTTCSTCSTTCSTCSTTCCGTGCTRRPLTSACTLLPFSPFTFFTVHTVPATFPPFHFSTFPPFHRSTVPPFHFLCLFLFALSRYHECHGHLGILVDGGRPCCR